ncbi:TonB-dependent receptor domain-containing protein [Phenylobacterium sp.]|uniref:TonB-dependent receptor domain-containing protein n=1 Tax=Phenylobacterium sp. TaxID=1871053 RepID=UPI002F425606
MRPMLLSTAALAALSSFSPAFAQTATPAVAAQAVGELIVTANRTPQRADRIGQSVTVIDHDAITASQALLASDLLARVPGVSVTRNGGPGGVTSVRIRGAEDGQTVLAIDGVKLNDPASTSGGYNFANLMIGDADRIEVLRGSQSTLWGSQAIGGVVNILTARATKPFEATVQAEGGSMSTADVRATAGGAGTWGDWRIAAGRFSTRGVSAYRYGTEKDGYRNTGATARGRVQLSEAVSLDLRGYYSKGRNEFDGFPAPAFSFDDTAEYALTRDLVGYAGVNFDLLGGALKNRLGVNYTRTDRDQFNPAQTVTTKTFDARGRNRRFEYQGVWTFSEAWAATFGAESEDASMRTASPSSFDANPAPVRGKAGIDSLYAQVRGMVLQGLTLTGGLRRDSHDTFGDHTLGQADLAWSLNDGNTVLRASYGQGFKAPTLYQLYSIYGNLALAPEQADGWDAGIEQRFVDGRLRLRATWFERATKNQIDFVSCFASAASPVCFVNGVRRSGGYDNVARTKAEGAELEASADLGPLTVEASYTYTHARNAVAGSANDGNRLPRRPEQQADIAATYTWANGAALGGEIRYVGRSFDDAANATVLQAYTLLDLRASYPVNDAIEVFGRVENAFDDDYETVRNYGSTGRAAYLGVRGRF